MLDRKGFCPNCKINWEGKDILEHLSDMDVFTNESEDKLKEIANKSFNWKQDNPQSFSEVIIHSYNGKTVYQCPNIKCMHVFDPISGEEYFSMFNFKINKPIKKIVDEQDNTDRNTI